MHPPTKARERILLIGPWGAGKSTAWRRVWDHQHSESEALRMPGKLYVVDTDRAAFHVCPEIDEGDVREVYEWPEYMAAVNGFTDLATQDDWLVVDRIDPAYKETQSNYIREVYGKTEAEFYKQWKVRSHGENTGTPLADAFGSNWQVIGKDYHEFITKVMRWPGHVLACAAAEPIKRPDRDGKGGDDATIIDAFGRFGVKPAGQRMLGFQFLSVILMNPKSNNDYVMTAMKQINRPPVLNVPVKDFVMDYLVQVAGWELK